MPTTNQVSSLLSELVKRGWVQIEVEEILLRTYKVVPERLRPEDRMVGHTGYLVFARKVDDDFVPAAQAHRRGAAASGLVPPEEVDNDVATAVQSGGLLTPISVDDREESLDAPGE